MRALKISASPRPIALAAALLFSAALAYGQAEATANRSIALSGFGAVTGAYTGIQGGRNLGITAGFDVGFRPFGPIRPEIEIRGTYPMDSGQVVGEKDFLGGIKLSGFINRRFHPYGDFFYGRGEMHYAGLGYLVDNRILYQYTSSGIYAFGGGLDYDLTDHFAIKADAQFQDWKTPVTTSGSAYPSSFSIGVLYRINVGRNPEPAYRYRNEKTPPLQPAAPPPAAP